MKNCNMMLSTIVVLFLSELMAVESCMCMPVHPQNAFCKSDFVFKVEVTSQRRYSLLDDYQRYVDMGIPPPRRAYYNVSVMKIFKGEAKIRHLLSEDSFTVMKAAINTMSGDGANSCGLLLRKGEKYLLAGRVVDGKMETSMCDLNNEWHHVTKHMKRGINDGAYDCSCPVATCIDGYCDRENSCKWNTTWDKSIDECSMKYRMCAKSSNDCEWLSDTEYPKCFNSFP